MLAKFRRGRETKLRYKLAAGDFHALRRQTSAAAPSAHPG